MLNENQIVPYTATELPVAQGPWLVFAPHADDESFGMGGTLAKAAAKGVKVELVIMTDGALGGKAADLVAVRQQEARAAAAILGCSAPRFLGNADRGVHVNAATVAQIAEQMQRVKPAAVFFPGPFELHPDHRTTATTVWRALGESGLSGTIPVSYEILVQSPVNVLVDITAFIKQKEAAMAVYASQLAERDYQGIALSLNRLRALTLSATTTFAEGYFVFQPGDVRNQLREIFTSRISALFDS